MKDGFKISGAALAAVAVVFLLVIGFWVFRVATADIKGEGDQKIATEGNAAYRIAAYDHFYNLCASVQSKEDQVANLLMEEPTTPDRKAQIVAAVTALRNIRASLVRQYNADARKADTQANFRASDLPFQIDPTQESTSCTA